MANHKYLYLFIIAAMLPRFAYAVNWIDFGGNNGLRLYFDAQDATHSGNTITVWQKYVCAQGCNNVNAPQNTTTVLAHLIIQCNAMKYSALGVDYQDSAGHSLQTMTYKPPYTYIAPRPGGNYYKALGIVCYSIQKNVASRK